MLSINSLLGNYISSQIRIKSGELGDYVESLASGTQVNPSVADFTVGSLLSSQSTLLQTLATNVGRGSTLLDTAKTAINSIIDYLEEQKILAVQAQDTSLSTLERAQLNTELQAITTSINNLVATTDFNDNILLNGSISNAAALTSLSGQSVENYTVSDASQFTISGTVASGNLATSGTFALVETQNVGKTAVTATLTLTHDGGGALAGDASIEINGTSINFGSGETTSSGLASALVTQLQASTDDEVRKFTYSASGNEITITATELGTDANTVTFELTDAASRISAATLGTDTIASGSVAIGSATGATAGTNRSVDAADRQLDTNLLGSFSNFAASYSTSGVQNTVTFTVDVNGTTYTSQGVTLYGTGGFNSKGNTFKSGQEITFTNTAGATDGDGEFTESAFTLQLGSSDVTVSGTDATGFQTALTNIAEGFETQLGSVLVNQQRDVVLAIDNAVGGDNDITAAADTIFAGIEGFNSSTGASGDILLISDKFGDDGTHGRIGAFSYDVSTNKITTTIDGEVFTADLSKTSSDGKTGYFDIAGGGGADFDTDTDTLTFGNGVIVFESSPTMDSRQLKIDLSNLTADSIQLNSASLGATFSGYLDTLFGVDQNSQLSFQVGQAATDTLTVNIDSASTSNLYRSDSGNSKTLDISTIAGAEFAESVLDNAINAAETIQASINGNIAVFENAEAVNTTLSATLSRAASVLLNTDVTAESVKLAEVQALLSLSSALLGQTDSRFDNILNLLSNN